MQWLRARFARWSRQARAEERCLLQGKRVQLRPVDVDDAEQTYAFVSDPEVTHFLPWEPATSVATVRSFLEVQSERRRRGESLAFSIVLQETGVVIGSTDLMQLRSVAPPTAELGYVLARTHWGQGLMTEAAALTRDYAFCQFQRRLLVGYADQENVGSRRVLEKIGMKEKGTEWRTVKGETRLYVRYELTREDWEENVRE